MPDAVAGRQLSSGGAHAVYADGAVRFLPNNIDLEAYQVQATISCDTDLENRLGELVHRGW